MKNFLTIDTLEKADIEALLTRIEFYDEKLQDKSWTGNALKGKNVLLMFFENSTRTSISFETAARKLGAELFSLNMQSSSTKKGESLLDTIWTMEAITKPDILIIRHSEYGAPDYIADRVDCAVVNAGDSWRAHPTQALLDAYTIKKHKGDIEGQTVTICGDISHSRVASSNIKLLTKLGAKVRVVAPPALMPQKFPAEGVETFTNMDEGVKDSDIIMTIRLQKERMEKSLIKSDSDYFNNYGLTMERLSLAKPDAVVLDPGPFIRNVQIADDVADHPEKSLILKQVANGVPTRMAVMERAVS
jgi:aspartate carbamoyltransferase catalytic subunit